MHMLDVVGLTKTFRSGFLKHRRVVAVDNVSFSMDKGEFVSLLGESGSGKTTLARLILRLTWPDTGRVLFEGQDVFSLKGSELKWYRRKVQAVFQDPYVTFNPFYKVDRALKVAVKKFLSVDDPMDVIHKVLVDVRLNPDEVLGRYPHQLSGGQLQRMLIARALIPKPDLLIADEPISMIDMSLRVDILNLLRDLGEKYNMAILMITHEANMAFYASDKVIIMHRGKFVEMGNADEISSNPLHPYTHLLVEAMPRAERNFERKLVRVSREKELSLAGRETVSGCRFYPRCPYATSICREKEPPLEEIKKDHLVACWLYTKG